jgi:PAS domain S-box-containing protein
MRPTFTPAEFPSDEANRVAALHALQVLDTPPEGEFDALVKAAALVCGVPIALISLIDTERQWFKARLGLDATETPRNIAFCSHAILDEQIFEVPNTLKDPRFAGNPLVTEAPDIRFYAGAPLTLSTGERIGTLCVIDREPRQLDTKQREILKCLAETAAAMLERRVQARRAAALQLELDKEQAALRDSEKRYQSVVEAMISGFVLQDAEGAILSCNRSAETLLGLSYEQLIGKRSIDPSWHCVHEDLTPWPGDTHPPMVALRTGKAVLDAVMGVYKPDGQITWITINAKPMWMVNNEHPYQVVTSFADITARKRVEDELRQRERFLQTLTQALPGMISYWDLAWTCQFSNPAHSERFGKTTEQMQGIHARDLFGPALFETNRPWFEAAFAGERQRFERTLTQEDGSQRHLVVEHIPDFAGDKVVGIVVTVTDITEIKTRQLEVEHLNVELKHSTALAKEASLAKSRFLANMSHEIRTPLNAVLGMLSLLERSELSFQQTDYVAKSRSAANSLLSLLNDILDLSKVEAGKLVLDAQPFQLDQMMRDIAVILSSYLGAKPIDVLFDIDPSIPAVLVLDADRLRQVLINLAGNAVKFTAEGEVVIGIRLIGLTRNAAGGGLAQLEFAVRDTGIGIAKEAQVLMFTDFTQAEASTTRKFGGTGLGLAISQRLIQMMGGVIELSSEFGKGSTFSFVLNAPVSAALPDALPATHQNSLSPRRTLVVDDNAVAGDLIAGMVRRWNWPVQVARSGQEAMALMVPSDATKPFPFQVIYLDWHMPDMDGWQLAGKIRDLARQRGAAQPTIVMVTGQSREFLAQRTLQEQSLLDAFLVKPMTSAMLQEAALGGAANDFNLRKAQRGKSSERRLVGMRILVVEDNLINQQVAEELLVFEGALVSMAANGQIGVEAVAAAHPQFDVVLMDVQMPVMDGYAATRFIREVLGLSELPIVAMTANAMASDRADCLAAGMNEHIGKPFDINPLVRLLLALSGRVVTDTSSSSAPLPDTKAAVDGLDLNAALQRMSGSSRLYTRSAREFATVLTDAVDQFMAVVHLDIQTATLQMHSLKGVAALLGATELAKAVGALEQQCRAHVSVLELEQQARALRPCVTQTIDALHQAVALLETAEPNPTTGTKPQSLPSAGSSVLADGGAMDSLLAQLEALLSASDLAALMLFTESQDGLTEFFQDPLASLGLALEALDFDDALLQCQALRGRLKT